MDDEPIRPGVGSGGLSSFEAMLEKQLASAYAEASQPVHASVPEQPSQMTNSAAPGFPAQPMRQSSSESLGDPVDLDLEYSNEFAVTPTTPPERSTISPSASVGDPLSRLGGGAGPVTSPPKAASPAQPAARVVFDDQDAWSDSEEELPELPSHSTSQKFSPSETTPPQEEDPQVYAPERAVVRFGGKKQTPSASPPQHVEQRQRASDAHKGRQPKSLQGKGKLKTNQGDAQRTSVPPPKYLHGKGVVELGANRNVPRRLGTRPGRVGAISRSGGRVSGRHASPRVQRSRSDSRRPPAAAGRSHNQVDPTAEHSENAGIEEAPSSVVRRYFPGAATSGRSAPSPSGAPQGRPQTAPASQPRDADASAAHTPALPPDVTRKMELLEFELRRFHKQTRELERIRREQEEELRMLRTDNSRSRERLSERERKFEQFRREETQKLKKERVELERRLRTLNRLPSRAERDEIAEVRKELTAVQNTLKKKEAKWKAANDRLLSHNKALAAQNTELKEQLKKAEQLRLKEWEEREEHWKQKLARARNSNNSNNNGNNSNKRAGSDDSAASSGAQEDRHDTSRSRGGNQTSTSDNAQTANTRSAVVSPTRTISPRLKPSRSPVHTPAAQRARQDAPSVEKSMSAVVDRVKHKDGREEEIRLDGSRKIRFPNGTVKEIAASGYVCVRFTNGDVKETFPDNRVVYLYFSANTTHITYPDGLQVFHFGDKQTEKHYPNGTKEIIYADETVKYVYANGDEQSVFADGTIQKVVDGVRSIEYVNGEKDVFHPDGSKTRYYAGGLSQHFPPELAGAT